MDDNDTYPENSSFQESVDATSAVAAEAQSEASRAGQQFLQVVTDNPLPAALAAAAVGAGLMALATMMVAPSRPSLPKVKVDVPDDVDDQVKSLKSLRSQLSALAQGVLAALPSKGDVKSKANDAADDAQTSYESARDALSDRFQSAGETLKSAGSSAASSAGDTFKSASETIRSVVGDKWDVANDALKKWQPQVDAVAKVARDNPMWAAVLAGAAGTLIGWQVLGSSRDD